MFFSSIVQSLAGAFHLVAFFRKSAAAAQCKGTGVNSLRRLCVDFWTSNGHDSLCAAPETIFRKGSQLDLIIRGPHVMQCCCWMQECHESKWFLTHASHIDSTLWSAGDGVVLWELASFACLHRLLL